MDLRSYLDEMGVPYLWSHHDPAFTAQDLAMAEHVSGKRVVKGVIVEADGRLVMCALPACRYVDLEKLREAIDAQHAELAEEPQFAPLFAGCAVGAEPPIGSLFGLMTVMDDSLMGQEQLTFAAGTHEDGVTISIADFVRLTNPRIGHFGMMRA